MTSNSPGERVQSPEAAAITGLSLWQVQHMAVRGEIPGAAKLGCRWTFNIRRLKRWKKQGMPRPEKLPWIERVRRQVGHAGQYPRIYFVAAGKRAVKIGTARNVKSRLAALQTANHEPLRVLGSIRGDRYVERAIHRKFAKLRIRGEWFRARKRLFAFIEEAIAYEAGR